MRILLANKYYYRRGGDCVVTMELEEMLKEHGHEVAIFAMDYPDNMDSPWKEYWPSNMSVFKVCSRPFGDKEVKDKFMRILNDFRPDVVHLHNIHTQLSPLIADIAHANGIRVVWTLHDSKLVCPCYTCQRNGKWCEACFTDSTAVIRHRCMPGSVPGAIIGYLEAKKWNVGRLCDCTDVFLPPSQFLADTCIRAGYPEEKFKVLCNFINSGKVLNPSFDKLDYYCFLGRVSEVKGIRTLCEAASRMPYKLMVIGGGALLEELRVKYPSVDFYGQKSWEECRPIIERAKFTVLPSEWCENSPMTVIESLSLGTPVLGARIGGIPELIEEGVNGMTFTSGDVEDLRNKISSMWNAEYDYETIANQALEHYSAERYYNKLIEIYSN